MTKRILAVSIAILLFSPLAIAQQQGTAPATQQAQRHRSKLQQPHSSRAPKAHVEPISKKKRPLHLVGPGSHRSLPETAFNRVFPGVPGKIGSNAEAKKVCEADVKKDCAGMKLGLRRIACIRSSLANSANLARLSYRRR